MEGAALFSHQLWFICSLALLALLWAQRRKSWRPDTCPVDLSGKTAIVTGASSGESGLLAISAQILADAFPQSWLVWVSGLLLGDAVCGMKPPNLVSIHKETQKRNRLVWCFWTRCLQAAAGSGRKEAPLPPARTTVQGKKGRQPQIFLGATVLMLVCECSLRSQPVQSARLLKNGCCRRASPSPIVPCLFEGRRGPSSCGTVEKKCHPGWLPKKPLGPRRTRACRAFGSWD